MDDSQGAVKCPHCDKVFAKPYSLKSHLVVHMSTRPHVCEDCGHSFARRHDMLRHIRTIHGPFRPFKCAICSTGFSKEEALRKHVDLRHSAGAHTAIGDRKGSVTSASGSVAAAADEGALADAKDVDLSATARFNLPVSDSAAAAAAATQAKRRRVAPQTSLGMLPGAPQPHADTQATAAAASAETVFDQPSTASSAASTVSMSAKSVVSGSAAPQSTVPTASTFDFAFGSQGTLHSQAAPQMFQIPGISRMDASIASFSQQMNGGSGLDAYGYTSFAKLRPQPAGFPPALSMPSVLGTSLSYHQYQHRQLQIQTLQQQHQLQSLYTQHQQQLQSMYTQQQQQQHQQLIQQHLQDQNEPDQGSLGLSYPGAFMAPANPATHTPSTGFADADLGLGYSDSFLAQLSGFTSALPTTHGSSDYGLASMSLTSTSDVPAARIERVLSPVMLNITGIHDDSNADHDADYHHTDALPSMW
ncbi:hypothetical protein BC831DRAFT_465235 [Entophlyctis helioformis]|nr:hypothetical protein BC831DRAFT_465235 [Entophlyctis helioformis]